MNIKYYEKEENVFQLAAHLAEKIMKNHAYQDGNKRTALLAADMFLKINGYKLQDTPLAADTLNDDIANAHVAVTTNQWNAKQLGEYYESIATPIASWTPEILAYRNVPPSTENRRCNKGKIELGGEGKVARMIEDRRSHHGRLMAGI